MQQPDTQQRSTLAAEMQALADLIKARNSASRPFFSAFMGPPAPIVVKTPTVAGYRAALAAHDWHFEQSDDHGAWCDGRDSLRRLVNLQRLLDPGFRIWNEYAPGAVQ